MSSDDTDTADSEHSAPDVAPAGGTESDGQPRDPETGQFLPKDERGGTDADAGDESEEDGGEGAHAEPADAGGATDGATGAQRVPESRQRAPGGRSSTADAPVGRPPDPTGESGSPGPGRSPNGSPATGPPREPPGSSPQRSPPGTGAQQVPPDRSPPAEGHQSRPATEQQSRPAERAPPAGTPPNGAPSGGPPAGQPGNPGGPSIERRRQPETPAATAPVSAPRSAGESVERELPPALDLVPMQVDWAGRPVGSNRVSTVERPQRRQMSGGQRDRAPAESARQAPPTRPAGQPHSFANARPQDPQPGGANPQAGPPGRETSRSGPPAGNVRPPRGPAPTPGSSPDPDRQRGPDRPPR